MTKTAKEKNMLPDVLIQHPSQKTNYLIPGHELSKFVTSQKTWKLIDHGTVTFVVPDKKIAQEVPPYLRVPNPKPSILIQYPKEKASYFLTYSQLKQYKINRAPKKGSGYDISFLLPYGMELVEELPAMVAIPLQSGEAPRISYWASNPVPRKK
jgi:hypothetical protein